MPTDQQLVFQAAAAKWESIIIGDISETPSSSISVPPKFGCTYPPTIDDIFICGVIRDIDGAFGQIGTGRVTFVRPSDGLPVVGELELDSADVDFIESIGVLETLVLHEMG